MKHGLLLCGVLLTALPAVGQGLSNQGASISIQAGAQVSVVGDVRVSSNGTIDNAGTLMLTGNWDNRAGNGILTPGTGTVQLLGTAAQAVGGTSPTTFHTLDISTATGPVTLTADASVGNNNGTLTLGATQLQLNSQALTLNNGTTTALSATTGRLISETPPAAGYGRLIWVIGANTGTYEVPMGTATTKLPITVAISAEGNTGGSLSFATYPTPADNLPLPTGVLALQGKSSAALDRYWIIRPANYTLAPASTLSFTYQESEWNAAPNIIDEARLRLQHWGGASWEAPQGSGNGLQNRLTSDIQNTYGIFTAADFNNPLPVELREFTAQAQQRQAILSWSTAQELNNKGFEVEVSPDGQQFQRLGFVPGHGTTSIGQQYRFTDTDAARRGPVLYYRLRQLNQDDTDSYSGVRAVRFATDGPTLATWPNPAHTTYTVLLTATRPQTAHLTLQDALGREVSRATVALQAGQNRLPATFATEQATGVYLLSTVVDGQVLRTRLVRE